MSDEKGNVKASEYLGIFMNKLTKNPEISYIVGLLNIADSYLP